METSLEATLALVLERGIAMCCAGWHVYRTRHGSYILLHLDGNSNIVETDEMVYQKCDEAVTEFVSRSGLANPGR